MVYVIGRAGSGSFSQLHHDHEQADAWQATMEQVCRHPVMWERYEVGATSVVGAAAEIARQK